MPDGILAVRSDLTVDWLNDTAGRLTGWDPEEAAGHSIVDIMPAQDADGTILDHRQSFLQAPAAPLQGPVDRGRRGCQPSLQYL